MTNTRPAILSGYDPQIDDTADTVRPVEWYYEYIEEKDLYKAVFLVKGQPTGMPGYGKTQDEARRSFILDNDYD